MRWQVALAVVVVLLLAGEIAGRMALVRPDFVPPPSRVAAELWRWKAALGQCSLQDLTCLLLGMAIGLTAAVILSLALDLRPGFHRARLPALRVVARLPLSLLALFLPLWWPEGQHGRVVLSAFLFFVAAADALLAALASLPRELTDLALSMGASRWQVLWKFRVPATLPPLFDGIRSGNRSALAAVVLADFLYGDAGLGRMAADAFFKMSPPLAVSVLVTILLLAVALEGLFLGLERFVSRPARRGVVAGA